MENIYIISTIIAFLYLLIKFAEMRMINKETKTIKELVTDSLIVFISVICGNFVFVQMQPLSEMILGDGNWQINIFQHQLKVGL